MGDVNAPVVLIMWSDVQCPFCGRFALDTEPALVERFVRKGMLRLEWRDFPYLGEQSPLAAKAARAAGEQGAFWASHDALYALKLPPGSGQLTPERLTATAAGLHLALARFTAAMRSPRAADAVSADFQRVRVSVSPGRRRSWSTARRSWGRSRRRSSTTRSSGPPGRPVPPPGADVAQVGLLAAFVGGALTLVSPCSALLLPSFFAYACDVPAANGMSR